MLANQFLAKLRNGSPTDAIPIRTLPAEVTAALTDKANFQAWVRLLREAACRGRQPNVRNAFVA